MEARDGSREIAPPVITCVLDRVQVFRQHIDYLKMDVATLFLEHAPDESHQEHAMEPAYAFVSVLGVIGYPISLIHKY